MDSHQPFLSWVQRICIVILAIYLFSLFGNQGAQALLCSNGQVILRQVSPTMLEQVKCVCTGSSPFRTCSWKKIGEVPIPPTPTGPAATWTPPPTSTPTPTPTPTATSSATPASSLSVAHIAVITDFEAFGTWRRGEEEYGTLTETTEQRVTGNRAAKLTYNFPAGVMNNYVIFRRTIPIEVTLDSLRVQVFGDESTHFLNVWLQDATDQLWQFTFGRIDHTGWQVMEASIDPTRGWPNGPIGNATTVAPVAPLRFYAFVLDGYTSDRSFQGTIYLDDLEAISYEGTTATNLGQTDVSDLGESEESATIISAALNVRSGPGTSYSIVTKVKQGEVYPVLSRDVATGWVQLAISAAPSGSGWVSGQYVSSSSSTAPRTQPTSTQPSNGPAPQTLVTDFETFGAWQRGDESWGIFVQSTEQKQSGRYSGKFTYDFPAGEPNNYIVFRRTISIAGQPTALRLQVYGDSSTHFLNAWVQDARGQLWQFTFGRINHSGWQSMEAPLDLGAGWPNGAIGHSANSITYPIKLYALTLDGYTSDRAFSGIVYVDDLEAITQ